jgi:hypothetical protein
VPAHEIEMNARAMMVSSIDVEFDVFSDGARLGDLKVSQGTLDWRPRYVSTNVCSIEWEAFDHLMQAYRDGRVTIS